MGGIKMRLSSDPTCQKSLTALVASAGEAGKVHPSKNDAISMLITRESPGGEEEKQTWADPDSLQARSPCFGWTEAGFADLGSPQPQCVVIRVNESLLQERSGSAARPPAARRYQSEFWGGREDWQWSAGLHRSGLNPGHDREVWCHEQHIKLREEGSASGRAGEGERWAKQGVRVEEKNTQRNIYFLRRWP